jgi:RNA recognition motif-containing protein
MAALRAMLAAKEAEVRRLQQQKAAQALQAEQQAVDERSIVVFGVSPLVPESVMRAHFSGCGAIKRCTMLPGRMHAAPGAAAVIKGAYVEFESSRAVLAAMGLTGTQLLDQTIQVGWFEDCEEVGFAKPVRYLPSSTHSLLQNALVHCS